jgi:hypothetical protein
MTELKMSDACLRNEEMGKTSFAMLEQAFEISDRNCNSALDRCERYAAKANEFHDKWMSSERRVLRLRMSLSITWGLISIAIAICATLLKGLIL